MIKKQLKNNNAIATAKTKL